LRKEPAERFDCDGLLAHEWLKDSEVNKEVFIKEFNKWKNSVAEAITFNNI